MWWSLFQDMESILAKLWVGRQGLRGIVSSPYLASVGDTSSVFRPLLLLCLPTVGFLLVFRGNHRYRIHRSSELPLVQRTETHSVMLSPSADQSAEDEAVRHIVSSVTSNSDLFCRSRDDDSAKSASRRSELFPADSDPTIDRRPLL